MDIKINQQYIFGDVDTHHIPQFFNHTLKKIFAFFEESGMVIPDKPYEWNEWQESQDTGIYVYAGRATSTQHDWIVEGYLRSLGEQDPRDYVFNHSLRVQNSFRNVKIEVKVLLGNGNFNLFFDIHLPAQLQEAFIARLLATS